MPVVGALPATDNRFDLNTNKGVKKQFLCALPAL
jgi:hypothetical protein